MNKERLARLVKAMDDADNGFKMLHELHYEEQRDSNTPCKVDDLTQEDQDNDRAALILVLDEIGLAYRANINFRWLKDLCRYEKEKNNDN